MHMHRYTAVLAHPATAIAYAVLLVGIVLGAIATVSGESGLMRVGMLLGLVAVPPLVAGHSSHAHQLTESQLEHAHTDGYRLALDHVARGLLDQHTAPSGPGASTFDAPDNVIALRRPAIEHNEREAL
ncbi:hypothetical protein ACWENS_05405 [Streptomyces sp. NPDC004532]